jgi:hypothetical protein
MATVSTRVSATFVDSWGIDASTALFAQADDTKTIAALVTEAGAMLTALQATSNAYLKGARITLFPPVPNPTGAPTAGSRVEQVAVLNFSATGTTKRYGANIPGISDTLLTTDKLTLAGVIDTLVAILTAAGTVLKWCNDHNQGIVAFVDAIVAFHKHRRQLQRSSFEVGT